MLMFMSCGGKKWLFWFCRRVGLCVGQSQMCHLYGWLKLFLKKCGGGKNKKHRVCLSVGLLAVQLQYCLYVFGHLSKWFVFFLMFKFWSVSRLVYGRPTIGYNVEYMQSRRLRTSNLSNRYDFEAGYNP